MESSRPPLRRTSTRIAAVDGGNQVGAAWSVPPASYPLGRYRFDNPGVPVGAGDLIDQQQARPNGAAPRLRFRLRNPRARDLQQGERHDRRPERLPAAQEFRTRRGRRLTRFSAPTLSQTLCNRGVCCVDRRVLARRPLITRPAPGP